MSPYTISSGVLEKCVKVCAISRGGLFFKPRIKALALHDPVCSLGFFKEF